MSLNPFGRDRFGLSGWDYLSLFNRREELFEKLSSRKMWAMIAGVTLTALGGQLGIPTQALGYIVTVVSAYIVGQGAVDAVKASKTTPK